MTQGVEMLPVEQSDRDMAASVLPPHVRDEVVRGEHDNEGVCSAVVQAFARHRLKTHPAATGSVRVAEATDDQLKDAVTELLSHRGEHPYCVLRGGYALWETWLPAFRAALRYLPSAHSLALAAAPTPDAAASTSTAIAAEALRGIADDYQTSEQHHPGHVLIPVAKFEQLRAAAEAIHGK